MVRRELPRLGTRRSYASYSSIVQKIVVPYFEKKAIPLAELKAIDIQAFYLKQRWIAQKPPHSSAVFTTAPKSRSTLKLQKGVSLKSPSFLGAFYGLRRSEAIGLKWDAIDFQNDTITIRHTVVSCYIDGKRVQKAQDITKTKFSMRTLPLIPAFKELLQHKKQQQNEFQRMCGKSYNKDYLGYICVDEMGRLLSPHYLTEAFAKLLKKHGLRKIRYHDLRHSCASLLLANGVPMKQIQEWLGHSDFSTTANVYAHLECNSKRLSAAAMTNGLQDALNAIS